MPARACRRYRHINGNEIGRTPIAAPEEIVAALDAVGGAFDVWRRMLPIERFRIIARAAALLRERVPPVTATLPMDQGKPLAEALREVTIAADIIDFLAEEAKRLAARGVPPRSPGVLSQTVQHVPVGPVAAFTPWSFPANLPARKLGAALAAGCSVIIKPDEQTAATCMAIVHGYIDAGLPAGVLNMLTVRPAEISQALIESRVIAKVSFIGSIAVGRQLGERSARHGKRYTAELGGQAPVIVCADYRATRASEIGDAPRSPSSAMRTRR